MDSESESIKKKNNKLGIIVLAIIFFLFIGWILRLDIGGESNKYRNEIKIVGEQLERGNSGLVTANLEAKDNPKGKGTFVYLPNLSLNDNKHYLWLVVDDKAYTLNGSSHDLTPEFPFPRENDNWKDTGLDMYSSDEAIEYVFD